MSEQQTVGAVIWNDRHSDTEVYVFERTDTAIEWAKAQARVMDRWGDLKEELTDSMREAGWLYYGRYSVEGDYLRVMERNIQRSSSTQ